MINPHRQTDWDLEVGFGFSTVNFNYTQGTQSASSNDKFFTPSILIVKRIDDKWAVGFGTYTPFAGGGATYENFLQSGHDLSIMVGYTAYTPAVAYKINERWSVGLGISAYYGIYKVKQFNADYNTNIEAEYEDLAGVGAHAGIMFRPGDLWSIGLRLRSPVHTDTKGKVKMMGMQTESKIEVTLPYLVDLGVGYQKDGLKAGASFTFMAYGDCDEIRQTTAGVTTTTKTGYRDGYRLSIRRRIPAFRTPLYLGRLSLCVFHAKGGVRFPAVE